MIANVLIASSFTFIGIVIGAMVLDQYHERQRSVLAAIAKSADDKYLATRAELAAVRAELARSESLVDALSREIAMLKAQRSHAEALHAERIRRTLEAARWN